tara:strand:- start:284 stop:940 length:657 start_codon:yes stop_codon:yes gene_type:complete
MKKFLTTALVSCTLVYCSSPESADSHIKDDSEAEITPINVKGVKATTAEVKDGQIQPRELTINKSIAELEKVIDAVEDSCNQECLYPLARVSKQERIEGFPGVVHMTTDTPLGSESSFLMITKKRIENRLEIFSRLLDKKTIKEIQNIDRYKGYKHNPTFNQTQDTQYILTAISEHVTKLQLEIAVKGNTFAARFAPKSRVRSELNKSREEVWANLNL